MTRLCSPKLTHTKNTTCPWARQFHPRRRRVSSCPRARFRLSAFEAIQIPLWFASRRTLASGQGARRPVRRPFCEQTRGTILPNKPGSILERAEAGLTITKDLRQSKSRPSVTMISRNIGLVRLGFAFRSTKRASCLRKNRFSATSAEREQTSNRRNVSKSAFYRDLRAPGKRRIELLRSTGTGVRRVY